MVTLPPDIDVELKQRMATGKYSSEDEILRQAFRALDWQDAEIVAIHEGIDDMEAGRVRPLREFDADFRRRKNISQDV